MSLLLPLSVVVSNDITWTFDVTVDGTPVNLTGMTVKTLIKAKSLTADSLAMKTYSSPSSGIVVTNAGQGQLQWTVPNADVPTPGTFWWRMDLTNGSLIYNVFYGPFSVMAA